MNQNGSETETVQHTQQENDMKTFCKTTNNEYIEVCRLASKYRLYNI